MTCRLIRPSRPVIEVQAETLWETLSKVRTGSPDTETRNKAQDFLMKAVKHGATASIRARALQGLRDFNMLGVA